MLPQNPGLGAAELAPCGDLLTPPRLTRSPSVLRGTALSLDLQEPYRHTHSKISAQVPVPCDADFILHTGLSFRKLQFEVQQSERRHTAWQSPFSPAGGPLPSQRGCRAGPSRPTSAAREPGRRSHRREHWLAFPLLLI